jgi:hypothetical protein
MALWRRSSIFALKLRDTARRRRFVRLNGFFAIQAPFRALFGNGFFPRVKPKGGFFAKTEP